jgi:hypothetical protein
VDDHEERLRRIEEKLDELMGSGSQENAVRKPWDDDDPRRAELDDKPEGVRSEDAQVDPHPADLALSVRTAEKGQDGKYIVRAEIGNYGEGAATRVRWWLSTKDGELVSTTGGGDETRIGPREAMQLEVVEIPGWENFPFQSIWCRLAWSDVDGDHEKRRPYMDSARGMFKWKRRESKQ